ncbi:diguanylate cyclase [Desulfocurvus sp. DL9XJH121]
MPEEPLLHNLGQERLDSFFACAREDGEPSEAFCARLEKLFGPGIFALAIAFLTHIRFPNDEARAHWAAILDNRRGLTRLAGRDLGLLVCVVDYFINVRPHLESPVTLEADTLAHCTRLMIVDDLTGLYNRRHFLPELKKEIERSRRLKRPLSLIMADLDHFKDFNDNYGHAAGDRALEHTGEVLRRCARLMDQAVRYGGEEFALILPHTSREDGVVVAERIRAAMARETVCDAAGRPLSRITMSLGLASFPDDGATPETLIEAADRALYRAKGQGRNRTCDVSDELRRARRHKVCLTARCTPTDNSGGDLTARVLDISVVGVRCAAEQRIDAGSRLDMQLISEGGDLRLDVPGARSVWSEAAPDGTWHMGIDFSPLPALDRERLETFLGAPRRRRSKP